MFVLMMKICNESQVRCAAESYSCPRIEIVGIGIERGFAASDPVDPFDMNAAEWETDGEDHGGSAE